MQMPSRRPGDSTRRLDLIPVRIPDPSGNE
jgi:hypothetical protein